MGGASWKAARVRSVCAASEPDCPTSGGANRTTAALAAHGDTLSLGGLTSLSTKVAEVLAESGGDLSLDGVTTLSTEAARRAQQP